MRCRSDCDKAASFDASAAQERADEALLRLGFGATPMKQMPVLSPHSLRKGDSSVGLKDFGARSLPGLCGGTPLRTCKVLEGDRPEPLAPADTGRRAPCFSVRTMRSSIGSVPTSAVTSYQATAQPPQLSGSQSCRDVGDREDSATKSPKVSPSASPRAPPKVSSRSSPRPSPRVSPRASPRSSPRASLRASPGTLAGISPSLPPKTLLKASSAKALSLPTGRSSFGVASGDKTAGGIEALPRVSARPLAGELLAMSDAGTLRARHRADASKDPPAGPRPRSRVGGA